MRIKLSTQPLAAMVALLMGAGLNGSAQTLPEALDNPGLSWSTTGGIAAWSATNSQAASDRVDYARSGSIPPGGDSYCETSVTGPGVVSFWWRVYADEGYDFLTFSLNDEIVTDITGGPTDWQYVSYPITNTGSLNLNWNYTRDPTSFFVGYAHLDQVKFTSGPVMPLGTALNTESSVAVWSTGGNTNETLWAGQTNTSRADGIAAESGAVKQFQESWMETTVFGVTNLSFWWKVSSITNNGWFKFFTNGVQLFQITGQVDWQLKTNILLNVGTNTLRWTYSNDDFCNTAGRGWLDEVIFSPSFAPPANITLSTPVVTNSVVHFTVTNKIGWPCKVYYSTNLAANQWTLLLSTNTSSSAILKVTDSTTGNAPYRYYRAESYY